MVSMGGSDWQHQPVCEGHRCPPQGSHIHFCTHRDTKEIRDRASGLSSSSTGQCSDTVFYQNSFMNLSRSDKAALKTRLQSLHAQNNTALKMRLQSLHAQNNAAL